MSIIPPENPENPEKIVAADLRALLRAAYPESEYAVLFEVRDTAGLRAQRALDALVVGYWPSRGCLIEGFEIKVSRSDWLRELKQGAKAQAFHPYCDLWWMLVANEDIIRGDELPLGWGLMCLRGNALVVLKNPVRNEKTAPIDNFFLAAIVRRACAHESDATEVSLLREKLTRIIKRSVEGDTKFELDMAKQRVADLEERIARFREISGVNIDTYSAGNIGAAVRSVLMGEHTRQLEALRKIKGTVGSLKDWLDQNVQDKP